LKCSELTSWKGSASNSVKYASLFFSIPGSGSAQTCITAWISNNAAPYSRRATAVALVTVAASLGGTLSTWLYGTLSPAPEYKSATLASLIGAGGSVLLMGANIVYLSRENKRKERKRMTMTKEQERHGLGDKSAWFEYSL
jgi:hypothetical protein